MSPHTGMVRRALLIIAFLGSVPASARECVALPWTARDFLTATTSVARAVAVSPDTLRVTSTLLGKGAQDGDVIRIDPGTCNPIVVGLEYFVAERCYVNSKCQWDWSEVEASKGLEQFVRNQHIVTRTDVMKKLRAWRHRKLSTDELRRWLSTVDVRDAGGSLDDSLVLAVVERTEDLLTFTVQAETCNPSDAEWLREHGSEILLARFARLPEQETVTAYQDWLETHEDAEDEWDPKRLKIDLERSLETARSWDHAVDCFLRSHREALR